MAVQSPFPPFRPSVAPGDGSRHACTTYARITTCTAPTATSADAACTCSFATPGSPQARSAASKPPFKHTCSVPNPTVHSRMEKPTSARTGCDVAMHRRCTRVGCKWVTWGCPWVHTTMSKDQVWNGPWEGTRTRQACTVQGREREAQRVLEGRGNVGIGMQRIDDLQKQYCGG